jgi:hypothetical protein
MAVMTILGLNLKIPSIVCACGLRMLKATVLWIVYQSFKPLWVLPGRDSSRRFK